MGSEFWISCRYLKWILIKWITVQDSADPLGIQVDLLLGPSRICGPTKISICGCVRPLTVFVSIRWTCGNLVSWPEERRWQRGSGRAICQSRRDHEDGLQRLQQNVFRWAPSWTVVDGNILVSVLYDVYDPCALYFRETEANNGVHVWEASHQRRHDHGH